MRVTAFKTPKISSTCNIFDVIKDAIDSVNDNDVLVISSKIIAIAEGSVVSAKTDKEALIKEQSEFWLDPHLSRYGHHFTVKHGTLIGAAGIDASNSNNSYVLLPKNPQESANKLRKAVREHYKKDIGVVVVDSVSVPLRRGAIGYALAHSGFDALKSYIGQQDIFGNPLKLSVANRAQGIAAAATLEMGEGDEQTPLAIVSEVKGLKCVNNDPTSDELKEVYLQVHNDIFEPFWKAVGWE